MRLTQKADTEHEYLKMCIGWYELPTKDYHVRIINETPNQMYQKLGRLEDIEDELGIDLITFLGQHPYAKHLLYNLIHNIPFVFAPTKEEQRKTWVLTKEELEK